MQVSPAERYREVRLESRVREGGLFPITRSPGELELQSRWFAGDFGKVFASPDGDKIDIIQFGTWNREAGPDFRDAAISINGAEPVRGSIEFDLVDRNWEMHGHATNPAFENTVLHVFVERSARDFFTRTKLNREVQQLQVDAGMLAENFSANIPLARPGRCQAPLKDLPQDRVNGILLAAAQFRLHQKAARLRRKIDSHGQAQALFQELAAALGYKTNKLPFTLLAQRLPLKLLREKTGSPEGEALLFGMAGFLQTNDLEVYKKSARQYVRELWDHWWPHRDEFERLILPGKLWRLSSSRPVNHPQRRLAAMAILAREWPRFQRASAKSRADAAKDFFGKLEHPFWNFHYTLTAPPSANKMALIGDSRIADILANVLFAFWLTENAESWTEYVQLPARLTNRKVETAATRLFGDDPGRSRFLRTVAGQQGLLQIHEDFCMQDDSDCSQCPFPEQMAKWT